MPKAAPQKCYFDLDVTCDLLTAAAALFIYEDDGFHTARELGWAAARRAVTQSSCWRCKHLKSDILRSDEDEPLENFPGLDIMLEGQFGETVPLAGVRLGRIERRVLLRATDLAGWSPYDDAVTYLELVSPDLSDSDRVSMYRSLRKLNRLRLVSFGEKQESLRITLRGRVVVEAFRKELENNLPIRWSELPDRLPGLDPKHLKDKFIATLKETFHYDEVSRAIEHLSQTKTDTASEEFREFLVALSDEATASDDIKHLLLQLYKRITTTTDQATELQSRLEAYLISTGILGSKKP